MSLQLQKMVFLLNVSNLKKIKINPTMLHLFNVTFENPEKKKSFKTIMARIFQKVDVLSNR